MVGERLRTLREQRALTQQELADAVGASQSSIAQYETGKRSPDGLILVKLADRLGVSSEYLLGLADNPERVKGLPPGWEKALQLALNYGFTPETLARAIRVYKALEAAQAQDDG